MSQWQRRSGIQLAYPYDPRRLVGGGRIKSYQLPWIVQPKFNGERCRAIVKNGHVTLLSSEENEITCLPHIEAHLAALSIQEIELDGELYVHGMPRQEIHSIVSRRENIHPDYEKMELHVFDIVDETVTQYDRLDHMYELMQLMTQSISLGPIRFAESNLCSRIDQVESLLLHYHSWEYEGVIIRDPNSYYVRKRSTQMMKWKPRKQDSYLIVGYNEEIDQYGTPKNTLGSIICESDGEQFAIGSGRFLTRSSRQQLWDNRPSFVGKYATVKYPELTLRGIPDHPVLIDITEEREEGDDN